jgi:hypothetical protein
MQRQVGASGALGHRAVSPQTNVSGCCSSKIKQ